MRLVITGARGFVGTALSAYLSGEGHVCILVSRQKPSDPSGLWKLREEILGGPCPTTITPDVIIHLEVKHHVQNPSAKDAREFREVNVGGTREWLEWAGANGVSRFFFFSSIKAAGEGSNCRDERDESLPTSTYGESKREAEELVRGWAAADPKRSAVILRPAVVYGPGNTANIYSLIRAIDRRRYFLVGKNDNIKSLVSLANVVTAVQHLLLQKPVPGSDLFYLVDEQSLTVAEIARLLSELLHRSRNIRSLPLPMARGAAMIGELLSRLSGRDFPLTLARLKALTETTHFSCAKLKSTGFKHPQTTREGLEEMVRWYLRTRTENPA